MRRSAVLLAAGLALAACHKPATNAAGSAAIPGAGEPRLAAGLWIERVSDRNGASETQLCLDDASAASFAYLGRQLNGKCSRHDMAKAADGSWHFQTICDMGAWGKVATEGVMHGDFKSHYQVEVTSTATGAANAADNAPRRVVADIKRTGDCPKDMKPGDVVLPDGSRSSLGAISAPA